MTPTVYSKPACVQCKFTKSTMDKLGIAYETIDVTEDEQALAHITGLGFQQLPVVIAGDQKWAGFKPDKIKELVAAA